MLKYLEFVFVRWIAFCGLFGVSQNEVLIPLTRLEWNPDIFFLIVTVEQSLVVARIAANGK